MATTRRPTGQDLGSPLNRAGVVASVAEQTGLSAAKAGEAVNAVLDAIERALRNRREVRLTGFGSFSVGTRKASTGRNPRTGVAIEVGPSASVRFKPGRSLKDAVGMEGG